MFFLNKKINIKFLENLTKKEAKKIKIFSISLSKKREKGH
jgi:hypothetical protein